MESKPTRRQRGVSEIYGTVLIISLSFLVAILLFGTGMLVMDQLQEETDDALSQDVMVQMDDRLAAIAGSPGQTTEIPLPDADSGDIDAEPDHGIVNISVTATEDVEYLEANYSSDNKEFSVGTIKYTGSDDEILAYQGGALIQKSGDYSSMMTAPPFNYDGNALTFDFINTSDLAYAEPGADLLAQNDPDASETFTEEIESLLSPKWSYLGEGEFVAPVEVTVTIESAYYEAWAEYAREGMTAPPDETEELHEEDSVRMVFSGVGSHSQPPTYEPNSILYAGIAANAGELWNRFNQEAMINDTGAGIYVEALPNQGAAFATQKSQLAFYDDYADEWVILGTAPNQGYEQPPSNENQAAWFNVANQERYDLLEPAQIEDYELSTGHEEYDKYVFDDSYADVPLCVVAYDENINQHESDGVIEHLETCAANLDVPSPGEYMPTDVNISFQQNQYNETVGDEATAEVTLENVGQMESITGHDVALYYAIDEELTLADYKTSETINEEELDEDKLEPGEDVDLELTWLPPSEDVDELHVVVGEHDVDNAAVNVTDETPELNVTVDEETEDVLPPGESLAVETTVENEANADAENVEVVLENEAGDLVDMTTVTVPGGETENVSLNWVAPLDEFDSAETLTVGVDESSDTHEVFPEGLATFEIESVDPGIASTEDGLDVEVEIENTGTGPGEQDVILEVSSETLEETQIVDTDNRTIDPDESDTFTLSWESIPELETGEDNWVDVRTADDSETEVSYDVEAYLDVTLDVVSPDSETIQRDEGDPLTAPVIERGDDVELEFTVENVGDVYTEQDLVFERLDSFEEDISVELDGGDSTDITHEWVNTNQARTGTVTIHSEDSSDGERIVVEREGPDCSGNYDIDEDGYRLVETVDDLQCINQEGLDYDYRLANDIDAYGTVFWHEGAGFEPIGWEGNNYPNEFVEDDWEGDAFSGEFDGDGHQIEGLYIDRPSERFVGLFGATNYPAEDEIVGWGSTLKNIQLTDVYVHGQQHVGGLVGQAGGTVENARSDGYVEAEEQLVGGLIGDGAHADIDNQLVAIGTVVGGAIDPDPQEYQVYPELNHEGIGGLVGRATWETSVSTAYARVDVSGDEYVGGITGTSSYVDSTFEDMYAIGDMEADSSDAGKIVGHILSSGDTFKESVYLQGDEEDAYGEAGNWFRNVNLDLVDDDWIGLADDEMIGIDAISNMNNLDFQNTWEAVYTQNLTSGEYEDEDYPRFEWESEAEGSFQITDVASTEPIEGGTLDVTAEIESTYGEEETQDVWLLTDEGTPLDRHETTIEGTDFGESETKDVDLTWDIEFGINGTQDLVVRTDDHDAPHTVDIEAVEEPAFDIEGVDVNDTDKKAGDVVEVDVELNNTGGGGSEIVVMEEDVGEDYRYLNHTTVDLDAGENETVMLAWETTIADGGDTTLHVRTLDDSETVTDVSLESQEPPEFEIQDVTANDPVLAGQPLTLNATIENIGDLDGEQFVSLTPGDEGMDTILSITDLSLNSSEQANVELTWETPIPDIQELVVSTQDDTYTQEIEVWMPTDEDITFGDPIDVDVDLISFDD